MMRKHIRTLIRVLGRRNRPIIAILAAFGMLFGVFGVGTAAFAAPITFDHFGGVYTSRVAGYASASNPLGGDSIMWDKNDSIQVSANVNDLASDGKGATLSIDLYLYDSSGRVIGSSYKHYELRNVDGKGSNPYRSIFLPWPKSYSPGLIFYVCNGKSSSGDAFDNLDCGAIHGPFHP